MRPIYRIPGLWRACEFQDELRRRIWPDKSRERARFLFNRWRERGLIPEGQAKLKNGMQMLWTDAQVMEFISRIEADLALRHLEGG